MDMVLMVAVDLMHKQKFLPFSSLHIQLKIVELKVREGEKQNDDVVIRKGNRKGERGRGRWEGGGEREKRRERKILSLRLTDSRVEIQAGSVLQT